MPLSALQALTEDILNVLVSMHSFVKYTLCQTTALGARDTVLCAQGTVIKQNKNEQQL